MWTFWPFLQKSATGETNLTEVTKCKCNNKRFLLEIILTTFFLIKSKLFFFTFNYIYWLQWIKIASLNKILRTTKFSFQLKLGCFIWFITCQSLRVQMWILYINNKIKRVLIDTKFQKLKRHFLKNSFSKIDKNEYLSLLGIFPTFALLDHHRVAIWHTIWNN